MLSSYITDFEDKSNHSTTRFLLILNSVFSLIMISRIERTHIIIQSTKSPWLSKCNVVFYHVSETSPLPAVPILHVIPEVYNHTIDPLNLQS